MKFRSEKGFTGVDISVAIIILFIFISTIATLTYDFNSSSKQIQIRGEAIEIAISEIEKVKNSGFEKYSGFNYGNTSENVDFKNQPVYFEKEDGTIGKKDGYYKTILVEDYSDISNYSDIQPDLVKKVTVTISYQYKGEEQSVNLSTILAKET